MSKLILLPIFGCLLLFIPALAQTPYCPPGHVQQYQHYVPPQKVIVHEQAYITVAVDSYAIPVQALQVPYYYSVSEAYREKAALRAVVREEMQAFYAVNGIAPQHQLKQQVQQPKPQAQSQAVQDDVTPVELQKKVIAAYTSKVNCVSCHGASEKLSGGFRLVLPDGQGGFVLAKLPSDKRWKIFGMSQAGIMPPAAAADGDKAMEQRFLPDLLQYAAIKD